MLKSLKRENSQLTEENSKFVHLLREKEISAQELSVRIKNLEVILSFLTAQSLNSELNGRLHVAEDEASKISINKVLADLEDTKKVKDQQLQTINRMEDENLMLKQDYTAIKATNK